MNTPLPAETASAPVAPIEAVVAVPKPSSETARDNNPNVASVGDVVVLTADALDGLVRAARRKGTLVNFWATWCGPCREELPMLAKLNREYVPRGLAVLPISVDEPEQVTKIPPMLRDYGFEGPYYIAGPLDEIKRRLSERWPGNIPVSFLLGPDASRHYFFSAEVYENELRPKLESFLRGKLDSGRADFPVAPGKRL